METKMKLDPCGRIGNDPEVDDALNLRVWLPSDTIEIVKAQFVNQTFISIFLHHNHAITFFSHGVN